MVAGDLEKFLRNFCYCCFERLFDHGTRHTNLFLIFSAWFTLPDTRDVTCRLFPGSAELSLHPKGKFFPEEFR